MGQKCSHTLFTIFIVTLLLLGVLGITVDGKSLDEKFLVIHLDAISSIDLFAQIEKGNLPNVADLFSDGQMIKHGVTLFPGGTEIMLTRMKKGLDNSKGSVVGWGYFHNETGKKKTTAHVFLDKLGGLDSRSRDQYVLALPPLQHLAGLSLLNLARIWETQDVAEFYWFHTDLAGHMFGREYQMRSLKQFDYYLGLAAKAGLLEKANIVLYTDHGMTTKDVQVINYNKVISDVVGDDLRAVMHPQVYLHDSEKKLAVAERVATDSVIEVALVKPSEEVVRGYTSNGYFEILMQEDKFRYHFVNEDIFGYEKLGYKGDFWSKEKWLKETKDHPYPALPPNLFGYLTNSNVGDIVAVLDSPLITPGLFTKKGNHAGLKEQDLLVPLLFTGPAFEEVEIIEEFWLYELFSKHLPMIDFNKKAIREKHEIKLSYPLQTEITFSPYQGWKLGALVSDTSIQPLVEYDLYSSFLTRVWVGGTFHDGAPAWRFRVQSFLGNLGVSWLKQSKKRGTTTISWRLNEKVLFNLEKRSVGLSILF